MTDNQMTDDTTPLDRLREAIDEGLSFWTERPDDAGVWPDVSLSLGEWRAIRKKLFGEQPQGSRREGKFR